ncbi:hypothetical protein V498_09859 [Pseudogymnoascus sp. VKM F-4517 (FW-2822)]|nr:hypothetical protein V498_09859 [Pseudogymnoascus sp. VKM F-4517 (FW-2822)]
MKTQISSCAHDPFKICRDQKRAITKIVATKKGVMFPANIKGARACKEKEGDKHTPVPWNITALKLKSVVEGNSRRRHPGKYVSEHFQDHQDEQQLIIKTRECTATRHGGEAATFPNAELRLRINCGKGNRYARTDSGSRWTAKIEKVSDGLRHHERDPPRRTASCWVVAFDLTLQETSSFVVLSVPTRATAPGFAAARKLIRALYGPRARGNHIQYFDLMNPPSTATMTNQILRAAGLFQALLTTPIALTLGFLAFVELWDNYETIYRFLTYTVNGLLAAIILFILLIQDRMPTLSANISFILEIAKSLLATLMWLWLLLDSALADHGHRYREPSNDKFLRVVRAFIAGFALLVLFYPTAIYATYVAREERKNGVAARDAAVEEGERTPLLSQEA